MRNCNQNSWVQQKGENCDLEISEEQQIDRSPKLFETKFFEDVNNASFLLMKYEEKFERPKQNMQRFVNFLEDEEETQKRCTFEESFMSRNTQIMDDGGNFRIIKGQWKNDHELCGLVQLQYPDGSVFDGHFEKGQKKSGTLQYKSGLQYVGTFRSNLFHGKGVLNLVSGTNIYADWKNGQPVDKKVKIVYDNGDVYEGEVQNYKKHGSGSYKIGGTNKKYVGNFANGNIEGFGTLFDNQKAIGQGMWEKGKLLQNKLKPLKKSRGKSQRRISTDRKRGSLLNSLFQ